MKKIITQLFLIDNARYNWKKYFTVRPYLSIICLSINILFIFFSCIFLLNTTLIILVGLNVLATPLDSNSLIRPLSKILENLKIYFMHAEYFSQIFIPSLFKNIFGKYSIILSMVDYCGRSLPLLAFLVIFRNMILTAIQSNPFSKNNLIRIQAIGLIFLLYHLFIFCLVSVLMLFNYTRIDLQLTSTMKMYYNYVLPDLSACFRSPFFVGLFAITFAEIFRRGLELKQETDLTV